MKSLSTLRRFVCYLLVVLPVACLQQEIRPQPDQNTRVCLLKEYTNYTLSGSVWITASFKLDYNKNGNPVKWTFRNQNLKVTHIYTLEYDGLRLKRMNYYAGDNLNLLAFRKYVVNTDITSIKETTFKSTDSTKVLFSREHKFRRNINNELRLDTVKMVVINADGKINRSYKRLKYDSEGRNVNELWSKGATDNVETLTDSYTGFDLNGRSHWNANFWLSFIAHEGNEFNDSKMNNTVGFWSENNLSILKSAPSIYYIYDLNEQGFPCISSQKGSDKTLNYLDEAFYYYYNCECRKR